MVEIGKVILPSLDFLAHQFERVACLFKGTMASGIIQSGKCHGRLRRRRKPLRNLLAVDGQVSEALIGKAPSETIDPADCLVAAQLTRIKIELFGQLNDQAGGKWPLVAFNQIEVAGRDPQPCCHPGLGQPLAATQSADGRTGHE